MTKLDGLDKLVADLRAMGKLDPKPIKVSLRRVAGEIIRDARAACPSKTVRNAYGFITKNESKFPTTVLIGVDSRKRGTKTMTAPALAQVIEYGTAVPAVTFVVDKLKVAVAPSLTELEAVDIE